MAGTREGDTRIFGVFSSGGVIVSLDLIWLEPQDGNSVL